MPAISHEHAPALPLAHRWLVASHHGVAPHTHPFPVLLIIQQGEVTLNYEGGKSKVYGPGDAFIEDVGIVHSSRNTGDVPIKALVVAIGVEGQKIMTPVK